jgi:hypothetical protein
MNEPLLTRRQLQDALERLAQHLHRRGVHAEIYLFGGGAMVLAHNARDATMDLDTAITQHHGPVITEARTVAASSVFRRGGSTSRRRPTCPPDATSKPGPSWIAPASPSSPRHPATCWP